eukprot:CAMPEP_0113482370 /NCGR_PEP_ID=MMETSP0014_2-20120614/22883_1 /TAXON_ID=2857 /ORGANISM="Nitzschia sp." /LENGTH=613 /DNA_ID=CAMNT_0000375883 /DNA_START=95 /DNA_END=1936 /DNA_ORIENTATION=- /assembly_acc=CAM_ASM_000159
MPFSHPMLKAAKPPRRYKGSTRRIDFAALAIVLSAILVCHKFQPSTSFHAVSPPTTSSSKPLSPVNGAFTSSRKTTAVTNPTESFFRRSPTESLGSLVGRREGVSRSNEYPVTMMRASTTTTFTDFEGGDTDTVVVMDWECVIDTTPLYVKLGIDAAFKVWPGELRQLIDIDAYLDDDGNVDLDNLSWLINKLQAISHVLVVPSSSSSLSSSETRHHPACEYALATRLILEEQALDQNQSTGLNGKYAKKFHPRQELKSSTDTNTNRNSNGSSSSDAGLNSTTDSTPSYSTTQQQSTTRGTRPLTVGELVANWRDSIRETLTLKYNVDRKDPIPVLDRTIVELLKHEDQLPELFPNLKWGLTHSDRTVIIACRHRCDVDILRPCLEESNIPFQIMDQDSIATHDFDVDIGEEASNDNARQQEDSSTPTNTVGKLMTPTNPILVVKPGQSSSSTSFILPDVLRHTMTDGTIVVYVDAVWYRLVEDAVPLFGDYIPRHGSNVAICGGLDDDDDDGFYEKSTVKTVVSKETRAADTATIPRKSTRMSLYLSEWTAARKTVTSSSSSSSFVTGPSSPATAQQNIEALANPWTLPISWDEFERRFLSSDQTASSSAFQ